MQMKPSAESIFFAGNLPLLYNVAPWDGIAGGFRLVAAQFAFAEGIDSAGV